MKAVVWKKYGPARELAYQEVDQPVLKEQCALVKVHSSSVNAGDCEIRGLKFPLMFKLMMRAFFGLKHPKNIILGQELSGVVVAVGKDFNRFKVGDEIFGATGMTFGGYGEYVLIKDKACYTHKPKEVSFDQAAGAVVGGLEAIHYLKGFRLEPGDRVLINGAGGSIGTSVLQLMKHQGAHVTVVDHLDKFDMLLELGADVCIDYRDHKFWEMNDAYHVVFDVIGKAPLLATSRILSKDGHYIIANPRGRHKMWGRMTNLLSHKHVYFKTSEQKIEDLEFLAGQLASGTLRVYIDQVMNLKDVAKAHEYVESGKKRGNLIIQVKES